MKTITRIKVLCFCLAYLLLGVADNKASPSTIITIQKEEAMEIGKIPIEMIKPAVYNPRVDLSPEDPEYQDIKKSMNSFGYVELIVWNRRTRNLISGHQRYKVMQEQGLTEIEVSIVDLSLTEEKILNIALNKIKGKWDEVKLSHMLEELTHIPDLDITVTGFDLPEISQIIDQYLIPKEEAFDFAVEVESIKNPITKEGDVICLGKHRLICGDSGKMEDLNVLMGEEKADLVYTDPPYNVSYDSTARPTGKEGKKWEKITSDDLPQEKYEAWLRDIVANVGSFLDSGASGYFWNGHRQFYFMHSVLTEFGYHVSSVITWAKERFAMGFAPYHWQTEHCLYFWKKDNGAHKWYGGTTQSNLWYASRDAGNMLVHPTQKPVSLAARAIKNSSKRGDIVLDLFAGSGSTIIAAEQLERRCYAVELSPVYCDAIARRYIAFVGEDNVSSVLREKFIRR